MDNTELLNIDNMETFVVQLDKLQRLQELRNKIVNKLSSIRFLKLQLSREKEELKDLLKTDIKEDTELKDLIKEVNND